MVEKYEIALTYHESDLKINKRLKISFFFLKKTFKKYQVEGNLLSLKCIVVDIGKTCQTQQPFSQKFKRAY